MNKKLLSLGVAMALGAICATTTLAAENDFKPQPPHKQPPCEMMKPNPEHGKMMHKKMQEDQKKLDEILNLTSDQKAQIEKNKQESKAKMKPIMQKMAKQKYELEKVMLSGASKESKDKKILKIKKEMRELKIQADEIRKADFEKFKSVLDDSQKAEFEKFIKEKKAQKKGDFPKPPKKHKPMPLPLHDIEK